MIKISSNAPSRIDLAGGTLDIWPIWAILRDAITINMAIDLHAELTVTINSTENLSKHEIDNSKLINFIIEYYRSHYNIQDQIDVKVDTYFPERAGLAGSSSIVISLISCLDEYLGNHRSVSEIINFASNIESSFLKYPTGTQDYYPILYGGINAIHYELNGIKHKKMPQEGKIYRSLCSSTLLAKPNGCHDSANLNWGLLKDFIEMNDNTIRQMNRISQASKIVYKALLRDNISDFYKGIGLDMNSRIQLNDQIVPAPIFELIDDMEGLEIECAKICGAGGNACVSLFCVSGMRDQIADKLKEKGFGIYPVVPCKKGIEIQRNFF